uniref:Uncharacterized protein n=1 Tax=Parascaris univalens TaxID=6257 RepID=A0A915A1U0_PARUN
MDWDLGSTCTKGSEARAPYSSVTCAMNERTANESVSTARVHTLLTVAESMGIIVGGTRLADRKADE